MQKVKLCWRGTLKSNMLAFLLRKGAYVAGMLLLIAIISFGAIHLAPNSFFASGDLNPNITPESLEQLKRVYGLDKPLWQQFFSWFLALGQLDFGISFASGRAVKEEILQRIPITLTLNIISMILVFCTALCLGIWAAIRQEKSVDRIVRQASLVSYAMPSFYLALLLVLLFGVGLGWFPVAGLHSVDAKEGVWYWLDFAWHLVLPIGVIVIAGTGSLTLYVRSLTVEILKSDYIFFAKARGIEGWKLVRFYVLPNLSPPVVTLLGLSLPGLIGGSVILESIFSINGMGLLFYQSALSRDYPVIMGILIIGALLTLLGNILADMVLLKLNPHFKRARS